MLSMDWFTFFIFRGKLRDVRVLPLKHASNRGTGAPVYEPFVKVWTLTFGNRAGIDDTGVCELLVYDQEAG